MTAIPKTNEILVLVDQSGLEQETSTTLKEKFLPFFDKAKEWENIAKSLVVTSVDQKEEMKKAREARLALKAIRVDADKTRKQLKEDSLRYGKAVQGVYNVIEYLIAPIEAHLEEQEKFAEIQELKRIESLREERRNEISPYYEFVPANMDFGAMSEEDYGKLLSGARLQKAEIERKRAEEEKKREKEREIQALHMERRDCALSLYQYWPTPHPENFGLLTGEEYADFVCKASEQKSKFDKEAKRLQEENERLRKEKEKAEAAARKEREEYEKKIAEQRRESERLAKIESDRVKNEEMAAKRAAREEKRAKSAPDRVKLLTLSKLISSIEMPDLTTEEGIKIIGSVRVLLGKVTAYIEEKTEEL